MKGEILKLEPPYNVIYGGGYVGRHIATLVTWKDEEDGLLQMGSFPIIDMGEEYPAGKLLDVDVEDCRVVCPPGGTNLPWLSKIIKYDFEQVEPAGVDYILHRLKMLDCKVVLPLEQNKEGEMVPVWDYTVTLDFWQTKGAIGDPDAEFRVICGSYYGFYFESYGTAREIYHDLSLQVSMYRSFFDEDMIRIHFHTYDHDMQKVVNRLNADQHIEGYKREDYDW